MTHVDEYEGTGAYLVKAPLIFAVLCAGPGMDLLRIASRVAAGLDPLTGYDRFKLDYIGEYWGASAISFQWIEGVKDVYGRTLSKAEMFSLVETDPAVRELFDELEDPGLEDAWDEARRGFEVSSPDEEMVDVYVGITFPPGMPKEQALEAVREIVRDAGYGAGSFDLIDESDKYLAGNLKVDPAFYRMVERRGSFSAEKDGVRLDIETP